MGLLAVVRRLRRRLVGLRTLEVVDVRGLPAPDEDLTRDDVDAVVQRHLEAGSMQLLRRHRLQVPRRWWRVRFPPPRTHS